MSLLNKTPYLNSVLSDLSSDELSELATLINGSGTFVYRSLVDAEHLLTSNDKMKAMNLQLTNGRPLVSGWFLGNAFIQYFPNRPEMQMYAIDLETMRYKVIKETFTATDLRSLLNGGSGGGSPIADTGIINLGTMINDAGGSGTAYFRNDDLTSDVMATIPQTGIAIIMFNTTCVMVPYVTGKENRFVCNAIYTDSGRSMVARGKLLVVNDPEYHNYMIIVTLDADFASASYSGFTAYPYGIIRFIGL